MDLGTQDILSEVRDASFTGQGENVFFLYVATPRKPPSSLHKKIIEPFLRQRGWQKVSYKNTGFRALYFLREKEENENGVGEASNSCESSHAVTREEVVTISSDEEGDDGPSPKKRQRLDENQNEASFCLSATQNATSHRTELKRVIEEYKKQRDLSFHVHIVLSRPIDYEEDFEELANTPNSIEF